MHLLFNTWLLLQYDSAAIKKGTSQRALNKIKHLWLSAAAAAAAVAGERDVRNAVRA